MSKFKGHSKKYFEELYKSRCYGSRRISIKTVCAYKDCQAIISDGDEIDGCVSHGICSACLKKHFPEVYKKMVEEGEINEK